MIQIRVKDGLVYRLLDGFVVPVSCAMADKIAQANGLVYAEHFVKKFAGQDLNLDDEDLKVIHT